MSSKYDNKEYESGIPWGDMTEENILDLWECKYDRNIWELQRCLDCDGIFSEEDIRQETENETERPFDETNEGTHICPCCHRQGISYIPLTISDIFELTDSQKRDLAEFFNDDFVKALDDYREEQWAKEEKEKKMGNKERMSLEEATLRALSDELIDSREYDDVDGMVDDILVVTDPTVSGEEYQEILDRAEEIINETPEGEIPFNEDYIGDYLLTCPICGMSFTSETILQQGDACPNCLDVPEHFIVNGRIESEDKVARDNGLAEETDSEIEEKTEIETDKEMENNEENNEETTSGNEEITAPAVQSAREMFDNLNASEEIRESEDKLEETKKLEESDEILYTNEEDVSKEIYKKAVSSIAGDIEDLCLSEDKSEVDYDTIITIIYEVGESLGFEPSNFNFYDDVTAELETLGWEKNIDDGSMKVKRQESKQVKEESPVRVPNVDIKRREDETGERKTLDNENTSEEIEEGEQEDDMLSVKGENTEVYVSKNGFGYWVLGLIVDNENKQIQLVSGQKIPIGKYKVETGKKIREIAQSYLDKGYTEYKTSISIKI